MKEWKEIITENQISKLSIEEQLKFYKKHFGYQHCELDGCGNEVHDDWTLYNGELFCESCFDFLINEERDNARKEIDKCQKQIDEYGITEVIEQYVMNGEAGDIISDYILTLINKVSELKKENERLKEFITGWEYDLTPEFRKHFPDGFK